MDFRTLVYGFTCSVYLFYSLPYNGAASKYYVTSTNTYSEYLLNEASKYSKFKGCNISIDMWFTSVIVARLGLEKGYAIIRTIRLDRKEIPKELKSLGNRREKSTSFLCAQDENIMFALYIDKKLSSKENVMVLTNMHDCQSNERRVFQTWCSCFVSSYKGCCWCSILIFFTWLN